jgi:phage terminase large subunit GpA-like protein
MPEGKFSERGVIPMGTVAVTVGADSQSDGFYYLLACWGRKMEVWLPLTGRITGDMRGEEVWKAFLEILTTIWLDKDGNAYRPIISALDIQGDFYPACLEFVRAYGWHRIRAVRGYAAQRAQASGHSFGILRNRYTDKTTGVTVTNIDVDIAKSQLANLLARLDPGPGYVHLPCGPNGEVKGGWDEEAIAELVAEYRRQTNVRGYTVSRWYKRSGRPNHRLDCFVYALAALAISRLKIDDCELQRVEARNVQNLVEGKKDQKRSPFGARRMIGALELAGSEPVVGGMTGFGVADQPKKTGFGAVPGSGVSL